MRKILFFALAGLLTLGAMSSCTKEETPAVKVTDVTLDQPSLTIQVGAKVTLVATINPEDASDKKLTWSSSNEAVAVVGEGGTVLAKAVGSATITVTTNDGGKTATCNLTVLPDVIPVTGVTLSAETLEIGVGFTASLVATVAPELASNKNVTWSSSDEAVATVADGVVTAVAEGTATITVTTLDGGFTATAEVTVITIPVTGVTLSENAIEVELGSTASLVATVAPEDASNKNVTWSSSDEAVATVADGTVTAVAIGSATITVTTEDGEFVASAEVTVTDLPDDLSGMQDFETDDAGYKKNYKTQGAPAGTPPVTVTSEFTADGEGAYGVGRALKVSYDAVGANAWDAQFFFSFAEVEVGKTYKFSMDVKSDVAATFETQSHAAPGEYIIYYAVGNVPSTTEWTHYEWVGTITADQISATLGSMKTIAFNLNAGGTTNTYYFDNLKWSEVLAVQDFEAADPTGFSTQGVPANDPEGRPVVTVTTALTAAGEGANGAGKALAVSYEVAGGVNATNAWDAQFFFEVGEAVVGETYTFSMDVKSDVAATFETQTHAAPSGYIIYYAVGNVPSTTEWTHYEATVTIAAEQAGMGAIAFNLSPAASGPKNTYYFDNITWTKP